MDIIKEQVGTESIEVHKELDRHTSDIAIEGKRACIVETHRSCVRATKAYAYANTKPCAGCYHPRPPCHVDQTANPSPAMQCQHPIPNRER